MSHTCPRESLTRHLRQRVEVLSPELALVDPELGRVARALLPDSAEHAARARLRSAVSTGVGSSLAPDVVRDHERPSRRVLVGVAAVTMLMLLLFDVRVQVGERPAVADSNRSAERSSPTPTVPPRTPSARSARLSTKTVPSQRPQVRVGSGPRRVRLPRRVLQGSRPRFRNGHERAIRDSPGKVDVWGADTVPSSRCVRVVRVAVVDGLRQSRAVVQTTISIPG